MILRGSVVSAEALRARPRSMDLTRDFFVHLVKCALTRPRKISPKGVLFRPVC
jgi:hypothetical protein